MTYRLTGYPILGGGGDGVIYFSNRNCESTPSLNMRASYGPAFNSAFIVEINDDTKLYIQKSITAVATGYSSYQLRDGSCINSGGNRMLYSAELLDGKLFETYPPSLQVVPLN